MSSELQASAVQPVSEAANHRLKVDADSSVAIPTSHGSSHGTSSRLKLTEVIETRNCVAKFSRTKIVFFCFDDNHFATTKEMSPLLQEYLRIPLIPYCFLAARCPSETLAALFMCVLRDARGRRRARHVLRLGEPVDGVGKSVNDRGRLSVRDARWPNRVLYIGTLNSFIRLYILPRVTFPFAYVERKQSVALATASDWRSVCQQIAKDHSKSLTTEERAFVLALFADLMTPLKYEEVFRPLSLDLLRFPQSPAMQKLRRVSESASPKLQWVCTAPRSQNVSKMLNRVNGLQFASSALWPQVEAFVAAEIGALIGPLPQWPPLTSNDLQAPFSEIPQDALSSDEAADDAHFEAAVGLEPSIGQILSGSRKATDTSVNGTSGSEDRKRERKPRRLVPEDDLSSMDEYGDDDSDLMEEVPLSALAHRASARSSPTAAAGASFVAGLSLKAVPPPGRTSSAESDANKRRRVESQGTHGNGTAVAANVIRSADRVSSNSSQSPNAVPGASRTPTEADLRRKSRDTAAAGASSSGPPTRSPMSHSASSMPGVPYQSMMPPHPMHMQMPMQMTMGQPMTGLSPEFWDWSATLHQNVIMRAIAEVEQVRVMPLLNELNGLREMNSSLQRHSMTLQNELDKRRQDAGPLNAMRADRDKALLETSVLTQRLNRAESRVIVLEEEVKRLQQAPLQQQLTNAEREVMALKDQVFLQQKALTTSPASGAVSAAPASVPPEQDRAL